MGKNQKQPKAKAKPKRTNDDVLALCAQAIRDTRHEMEFLYDLVGGDYPGSPKTLVKFKKAVNEHLRPKLSNFLMIENQLTKGHKEIQIGNHLIASVDSRLAEIREYLNYLKIASTSDINIECPQAFVDSIYETVDQKIDVLEQGIEDLKKVFGGQNWHD